LAREERLEELGRMDVGQRVITSIPSAITCVETTHCCDLVVDNAELLVMREVVDQFPSAMIRMTHDCDIVMKGLQRVLAVSHA